MTPRFPDGLTVLRGGRAWSGREDGLVRDSARIVQVVLPDGAAADANVEALRAAYRSRFRQEPVLRVAPASCMGF